MEKTDGILVQIRRFVFYIVLSIILFFVFYKMFGSFSTENSVLVDVKGVGMGEIPLEIYYTGDDTDRFTQENSLALDNSGVVNDYFVNNNKIHLNTDKVKNLRIDLGTKADAEVEIGLIEYRYNDSVLKLNAEDIAMCELNQLEIIENNDSAVKFISTGDDPYIEINSIETKPLKNYNFIYAAICTMCILIVLYKYVRFRVIYSFLKDLFSERKLIKSLAFNDFKTRFAGSYFGIIWAYVQPICTIAVFWFVFQIGFRNPNVGDVEYILWFMTGLIPWFFFSEAWNSATNAFIEYSYLVKKVVFKINILPLIKILSALFVHLFFVVFMILVYMLYRRFPTVYYLQIVYYMVCMVALVTALSFVTAPLIIFFKDLGQIMNIVLQFGMWLTPIMWSMDNLTLDYKWLMKFFKLNPMYYIVQGYRDSMIYNVLFYENIKQTVYFWTVIFALSVLGSIIYKRLKPHFADVL